MSEERPALLHAQTGVADEYVTNAHKRAADVPRFLQERVSFERSLLKKTVEALDETPLRREIVAYLANTR